RVEREGGGRGQPPDGEPSGDGRAREQHPVHDEVPRDLAVQPQPLEGVRQDRRRDRDDQQPEALGRSALSNGRGLGGDGAHPPPRWCFAARIPRRMFATVSSACSWVSTLRPCSRLVNSGSVSASVAERSVNSWTTCDSSKPK